MATPKLCVLLDMSVAVALRTGAALVGFTASTGEQWQSHEIVNWQFCETHTC